jgi:hypothetical protein
VRRVSRQLHWGGDVALIHVKHSKAAGGNRDGFALSPVGAV